MDYTIQSGDTLSAIAKKNGITLDSILKANPTITNPNLIRAGAKLVIPTVTPTPTSTTVQTTATQRAADTQAIADYNKILATQVGGMKFLDGSGYDAQGNLIPSPTTKPTTAPTSPTPVTQDIMSAITNSFIGGNIDPQSIYSELSKTTPNISLDEITKKVNELKGDENSFLTANQNSEIKKQISQLDTNQASFDAEIEKMKANLAAENLAAVESIKANSEKARRILRDSYTTNKAVQEKIGYAGGGFRYTPNHTENLLAKQEQDFTVNMAEIDAQEKSLLLQAAQAKEKGDWEILSQRVNQFNKTQDDKRALISNMLSVSTNYLKTIQAEAKAKADEAARKAKAALDAIPTPSEAATLAKSSAPAILTRLKALPDQASKDAFIEAKAKELGISIDVLNSTLQTAMQTEASNEVKQATAEARLAKATGGTVRKSGGGSSGGGRKTTTSSKFNQKNATNEVMDLVNGGYIQGNGTLASSDYKKIREWWMSQGGTRASFNSQFGNLIDKSGKNWKNDYQY